MRRRSQSDNTPGIIKIVKRAEGGPWFTIKQLSDACREAGYPKSTDTIKRWIKHGVVLENSERYKMTLGDGTTGQFVWLFSERDKNEIVECARTMKVGRRRKLAD